MRISYEELEIVKVLAYVIDLEENQKLYHSLRVAVLSETMAQRLIPESAAGLFTAGLLHDIGTFDLPNRLLHMEEHMEDTRVSGIRVHPQKGAGIVAALPGFIPQAEMILDHHEWVNGLGYPRGKSAVDLSPGSQILKITDKFAFMADTNPGITVPELQTGLKKRVGREFSREFYECLMDELAAGDLWDTVLDERRLDLAVNEHLKTIPSIREADAGMKVDLLQLLGRLLDAKHAYTEGHSRRVAYFSVLIALALGLSEEQVRRIEVAGYLHDIGKLAIPNSILDKDGPLTDEEYEIIKTHAGLSQEIVRNVAVLRPLQEVVGADQEHWDGKGYPQGLKGDQIPLEARIIFIADAFDAMTSHRSYHRAISSDEAVAELRKCAGKDFDPAIVEEAAKIFSGFENPAVSAGYYPEANS